MNPSPEEGLFQLALGKPVEKRSAFLDVMCDGDPALRARLEALLAAHDHPETLLATQADTARPTIKLDLADVPDEAVGQTLGRYKLLEQIGEGGCGMVYVAEQKEPVRRKVALKVIKLGMDTKQVVARFEAERQALAMMDHPNIAKVLDAGTTDVGRPFFVMELVRGIKITDYCDQASLSTKERLDLFIKVCHAIQHAHQKGIIHRDIKPSNILVTLHDGVPVPKVIDFGIAKATQGELTDKTIHTQFQQFIGTPAYMSPEQAEMSGLDIDTRSDIYSLGVLLYELLAGSTPFDAKDLMASGIDAMRKTIREKEPQRPSTRLATLGADQVTTTAKRRSADTSKLLHQLKGDLDWIVMKCLEKDRQRRYDTANGLAADIKRHLDNEPVTARPPSVAYRFQKAFRRNKLAFTAAGAVAAALLLGVVISAWQAFRATQATKAEARQRVVAEAAQADAQARQREAEAQRNRAEIEQQRADAQARKAVESQEHSRRLLYAADMNLAQQALKQNNLGRARRLLDRHRPASGEEDLRGWEWRYLWQQCRSDSLAVLTQRSARGFSVSFSPDGAQLAVGYFDGRIELWDVPRRILVKLLETNGAPAHVAFSPRSNLLAATSEKGTLKLHDLANDRETVLWQGERAIRELSFTPDGSRLLAFAFDGVGAVPGGASAMVFDVAQGSAVSTNITSGANAGTGIARLSSDKERLFQSHVEQRPRQVSVKCLEVGTGREIWSAELEPNYGVSAMALSPDDKILVAATAFGEAPIRVLDAETGRLIVRLEGHTGYVGEVAFSRDGRWLVSAAADQTIRLWETSGWTEARVFRGHGDEVHTVAFSPDGTMLASGAKDGTILLWDTDAARQSPYGHRLLPTNLENVVEYAPGEALAAEGREQLAAAITLRLEDLSTKARIDLKHVTNHPGLFYPPNLLGQYVETNVLRILELREGLPELFREVVGSNVVRAPMVPAPFLARCPEQRLIAWAEYSGLVHIASLDRPARRWHWTSELHAPIPREFSSEGKLLAVAGSLMEPERGSRLEILEMETGRLVLRTDNPRPLPALKFADAGRRLVAVRPESNAMEALFWDLTRPEEPPKTFTERGAFSALRVSPDGRWVAASTQAGVIALYDAVTMKRRDTLDGSMNAVFSVAFSPDNRRLASGAGGREAAKLWQVETGQELLTLPGQGSLFYDIAFAENGNTLLLGRSGQAGSWQMWRAPSWEVINATEAKEKTESKRP